MIDGLFEPPRYKCVLGTSVAVSGVPVRNILEERAEQGQPMPQVLAYASAAVEHFTL